MEIDKKVLQTKTGLELLELIDELWCYLAADDVNTNPDGYFELEGKVEYLRNKMYGGK